jgi:predicted RNA-binding Zn ribbon-like protein
VTDDWRAAPGLRFDAGAPWLDLLATVGGAYGPAPVERLPGAAELATWLDHEDLAPPRPPSDDDAAQARDLREVLRPLALAVLDDTPAPAADVRRLQPWLDADRPLQAVLRDGRPTVAAPATAAAALARVARQALEHLAGPERAQLGACAADDCRMVFLDHGGRRRWCAPERCGVRSRVRAHRARTRTPVASDPAGRR